MSEQIPYHIKRKATNPLKDDNIRVKEYAKITSSPSASISMTDGKTETEIKGPEDFAQAVAMGEHPKKLPVHHGPLNSIKEQHTFGTSKTAHTNKSPVETTNHMDLVETPPVALKQRELKPEPSPTAFDTFS